MVVVVCLEGCESIAGMVSAMDVSQRSFQCSIKNLRQTDKLIVRTNLSVNVSIAANSVFKNCNIVISQVSGLRVAAYSEFTEDVKQEFNNQLQAAMEGFLSNMQSEKTSGSWHRITACVFVACFAARKSVFFSF